MFHSVFTNYPLADIPVIPDGWRDVSWKNDACPCWEVSSGGEKLYVFADYADEDKRDCGPGVARFSISAVMGWDGSPVNVFDSDSWDELLATIEAPRFPVSLSGDVTIGCAPNAEWAWRMTRDYVQTYRMGDFGWRLGKRAEFGTWINENDETVTGWIVPLMGTGENA